MELDRKPNDIYTDNSLEFRKACEDLSWNHCTSTPHRSETNGIAERAVRRVKEGTSAVLLQSGLNESWWSDSMECYTCLRNVTDLLSDGKTPYERRFGKPFGGPIIPFVWFIGWVSPYNCERSVPNPSIWKESFTWIVPRIRIVRGENLEGWRTDRRPWGVGDDGRIGNLLIKDSMRKRWYFLGEFFFQSQMDESKHPGRRSGTENIHFGTASTNSRREQYWLSRRIRRVSSTTLRLVSGCQWSDELFLVHVRKLHIPPSRWTQSQTLLDQRWIISLFPLKYIDVSRTTHTKFWMSSKRYASMITGISTGLETCQILGQVSHTIYSTGWKTSRRRYVVRGESNEKTAYIQARTFMGRNLENNGKARQAEGETKVV